MVRSYRDDLDRPGAVDLQARRDTMLTPPGKRQAIPMMAMASNANSVLCPTKRNSHVTVFDRTNREAARCRIIGDENDPVRVVDETVIAGSGATTLLN